MINIIKRMGGFFDRFLVDKIAKYLIYVFAIISILLPIIIIVFLVINGLPIFGQIGVGEFLFGSEWRPSEGLFGAARIIMGSIIVMLLGMAITIFISIGCAILLAEIAPTAIRRILRPLIEILAGIPSVVYGLIAMILLIPIIRDIGGGNISGYSFLAAGIVLALMVLPTIVSITEDALRSVPGTYNEGALALGCSRWQSIWRVILPAAKSGIVAAVILGAGRAIGETMAVMMVIGNSMGAITGLLDSGRTIPGTIALEMPYAADMHQQALFGLSLALLLLILLINSVGALFLRKKGGTKNA